MGPIVVFSIMLCSFFSFGQSMSFAEFGYEPAQCRTFSWQSGNGVVYAFAIDGNPPLTYTWTSLSNGDTSNNTTWGGLNVGWYKITVTDQIGDQLIDSIYVDSINPIASFDVMSSDLINEGGVFVGTDSAYIELINTSQMLLSEPFPPHYGYNWKIDSLAWTNTLTFDQSYKTYAEFIQPGNYSICLRFENYNGCADTECKSIVILCPVFDHNEESFVSVYSDFQIIL